MTIENPSQSYSKSLRPPRAAPVCLERCQNLGAVDCRALLGDINVRRQHACYDTLWYIPCPSLRSAAATHGSPWRCFLKLSFAYIAQVSKDHPSHGFVSSYLLTLDLQGCSSSDSMIGHSDRVTTIPGKHKTVGLYLCSLASIAAFALAILLLKSVFISGCLFVWEM